MPFIPAIGVAVAGGLGVAGPLTLGAATAFGIGSIGVAGFLGKTLLGALSPKQQTPQLPALPSSSAGAGQAPSIESVRIDEQKKNLELARRKRTGTTLTSPQGLLSTEPTSQKTLLGG